MKLIFSLFLLALLSLLVNIVAWPRQPFLSVSEMREINRRLQSISAL